MMIGKGIIFKRLVTIQDFKNTAKITEDYNPIHIDPKYCSKTKFKKPVAHGVFLYGLIKKGIWELLGDGIEIISHEIMFPTPTYAGEELIIWVTISNILEKDRSIKLDTFIIRPNGYAACMGKCIAQFMSDIKLPHIEVTTCDFGKYNLKIGKSASINRAFTLEDTIRRANFIGDGNLLHIDKEYAKKTKYGGPVVPTDLLLGMISNLLGTKLPGPGSGWLKHKIKYFKPASLGEKITATVEIIKLRADKGLINLRTYCTNSIGEIICDGEALMFITKL